MKIYSSNLIKSIQSVIDSTKFQMRTFHEYDFMSTLNSADLILRFIKNSDGKNDCLLVIKNSDIPSKFINEWRETAPGKFCSKDYKQNKRDFIGNTLYHELTFELNHEKIKVLIRLLDEISMPDITDTYKDELINKYGDITIDGKYFSIIKIMIDSEKYDWGYRDIFTSINLMSDTDFYDNMYTDNQEETDNNDIEDIADETESSDPLF